MGTTGQGYFTEQLISHVFQERNLINFGSPEVPVSSPSVQPSITAQPLNRLSALVSGTAAAATRRASYIGRSGSPGILAGSARSEGISPELYLGTERGKVKVTRSVGYGTNIYVGTSDGQILWYTLDYGTGSSNNNSGAGPYTFRKGQLIPSRRSVDNIFLLPRVGKIAILCDGTLHFLALPSLDVLTTGGIQPIREVVDVALDDQEIAWRPGDEEGGGKGVEITLSIVKRKAISLYRLGAKLSYIQDIPLPNTLTRAVRSGGTMAIADTAKYCVVNLMDQSMYEILPISQVEPGEGGMEGMPEVNIAVIPGEEEFLCSSFTGMSTIGVFVNRDGDAIKGTIEWQSHPRSIVIEGDSVIALLRDDTVTIHSMSLITSGMSGLTQTITLPLGCVPLDLTSNPYGIAIPNRMRDEKLSIRNKRIIPAPRPAAELPRMTSDDNLLDSETPFEPPSGSGFSPTLLPLDPPGLEGRPAYLSQGSFGAATRPSTTTIAETLIYMDDGVLAVTPKSWLLVADNLIQQGKLDEAIKLTEVERKKGKRGEIDGDKASHTADLRYMYSRIAYQNHGKALFEDAGSYFHKSKIDPRHVVRLLSDHVGRSIARSDEAPLWEGAERDSEQAEDMAAIVNHKLRQIYGSPMVDVEKPSSEVNELRVQLQHHAKSAFLDYLRKAQASKRKSGSSSKDPAQERPVNIAIDTCLAKILAEFNEAEELLRLLSGPNDCLIDEIESFINAEKEPYLLCQILQMTGKKDRVVDILVRIADGDLRDPRCEGPVNEVTKMLLEDTGSQDLRQHTLWLMKKDPLAGLKVLIARGDQPDINHDITGLLSELRSIDELIAEQYLEHIVVIRQSTDRTLHDAYIKTLLDRCEKFLSDDGVIYHFRELFEEYQTTRPPMTYCQYIAETAHDSPSKTVRLKTILFLQGSPFYNLQLVEKRLEGLQALFYERAIVYGRLARHEKALRLLAIELKDSVSAETYCTQGGDVLPPKTARAISDKIKVLEPWATLDEVGPRRRGTIEGEPRQHLVSILLKVYMAEGSNARRETAALLNAQALHLDSLEVLDMVPDDWKVCDMSDFFGRALKRQMHERASWKIIKALSAGQNKHIAEEYARTVGRQPGVVEYPPTPPYQLTENHQDVLSRNMSGLSMSPPDEGSIADIEHKSMIGTRSEGEKSPVAEKTPISLQHLTTESTKEATDDRSSRTLETKELRHAPSPIPPQVSESRS